MNDKVIKAILKINPNAQVSVSADDIDTIVWENGTTPIAKSKIQSKMNELQAEYDANQYQRDRKKEYPPIADQLDDIYHNGIDGWKATIKATKDKYPKG
jgi:regulator of replication initiation timing